MYKLTSSTWGPEERAAVLRVLDSGRHTMGDEVAAFEREFAEKIGSKYAVMVNSGSSANLLAIAALTFKTKGPLKAGDGVIVPSLSWSTTYFPVSQYNMRLIFVDIDPLTLNLDIQWIRAAFTYAPIRAMFVPSILGNPADLVEIKQICDDLDLYLIEDACESLGAKLSGKYVGTFGIMGTYSLYYAHHISTVEGGVISTDDEELYHILLSLRAHGWTRNLPEDNRLCVKNNDFQEAFRFVLPGYNVKPTEIMAAIGREQLKKLDGFVQQRRLNAQYFKETFAADGRFALQKEHGDSSWFAFSMISRHDNRDEIVSKLKAGGVETRPIVAGNFLRHDVMTRLKHDVARYPFAANTAHQQGFYVGNHGTDIRKQIDQLAEVLG